MKPIRTTRAERRSLSGLAMAWNEFIRLPRYHPSEIEEFQHAIHAAQRIIATRIASRADPTIWPRKS